MTTESPCWFKSSYSSNGGACIEVAVNLAASRGIIAVQDSKSSNGPVLSTSVDAFASFISGVKTGDF
ncbi:DUF397 domain-containing protein [Streptomyces sp. NPDC052042]|uniref:DUF397 domain-containing protein n=1 Tax=Streptomyces sp. NPDC052042 TaxID=3365683 RepID=UPI0037CE49A0